MRFFKRGGIPRGTTVDFSWRMARLVVWAFGFIGLAEITTPATGLVRLLSILAGLVLWVWGGVLVRLYAREARSSRCARCGRAREEHDWWVSYPTQQKGYCWACWQDQVQAKETPTDPVHVDTLAIALDVPPPIRVRVVVAPSRENVASWTATAPDWPGCTVAGESPDEVFQHFQTQFRTYLRLMFHTDTLPAISYDVQYHEESVDGMS